MVKIEIDYQGQLLTEATHGPSGTKFITDAPLDNGGRASSFSPTDLVGAAVGSCMATIMGIFAQRHSIPLEGMKIEVVKTMIQQPIRRIGEFKVDVYLPIASRPPATGRPRESCIVLPGAPESTSGCQNSDNLSLGSPGQS